MSHINPGVRLKLVKYDNFQMMHSSFSFLGIQQG